MKTDTSMDPRIKFTPKGDGSWAVGLMYYPHMTDGEKTEAARELSCMACDPARSAYLRSTYRRMVTELKSDLSGRVAP